MFMFISQLSACFQLTLAPAGPTLKRSPCWRAEVTGFSARANPTSRTVVGANWLQSNSQKH